MFTDQPLRPVHRTYHVDSAGVEIRCAVQSEPVVAGMAEFADHLVIREPGARSSEISPLVSKIMRDLDDCHVLRSFPEHQREAKRDVLVADLKSHLYTLRMQHHRGLLAGAKRLEASSGMRSCAAFMIVPTHIASCTVITALPGVSAAGDRNQDWPSASSLF